MYLRRCSRLPIIEKLLPKKSAGASEDDKETTAFCRKLSFLLVRVFITDLVRTESSKREGGRTDIFYPHLITHNAFRKS